jgi:hypothetical protein
MGFRWLKTNSIAIPEFRRKVRKTWDNPYGVFGNDNGHTMPDEESPLLQNSSGGYGHQRRGSALRQFLFDRHHTPGQDSDNRVVRWSANAFNVAKATLLSSKCDSRFPKRLIPDTVLTLRI